MSPEHCKMLQNKRIISLKVSNIRRAPVIIMEDISPKGLFYDSFIQLTKDDTDRDILEEIKKVPQRLNGIPIFLSP
jgi:hypothetical protein